ncbi:DUF559 domain-containing protein [Rathayibacter tritici]|uniref:DUF559 domain-containing protein n=2 Tax=Rathayibacter tritici TaxID=33888 RepID=A0A160KTI4_9MICO|nr:hypothetical protein A6122_1985 [Rathayibacter tritici]PPF30619.1 DUF559 domain-containing protein [Rathayibacter tritici]PPF70777.1 DUF559 domain-containing protein [Rathayibacter tritici]PPG08785.1 DUF559 domain-containing protein [Rathayibacter tritici]PPI14912.1 DUF559 domain-containing protein [Rathayibacter tritici]
MGDPAGMSEQQHSGVVNASTSGASRHGLVRDYPVAVFRGARAVVEPLDFDERITAFAAVMRPGEFFSHGTAAHLLGLPDRRKTATTALDVAVAPPMRAARRVGVRSHHLWDEAVTVVHATYPTADPASTFCHLAASRTLDELVVLGDALVLPDEEGTRRGLRVDLTILAERARCFRGRGGRLAREAVGWVRSGAESPRETLLRLLLLRAGLPEPELNVELFDADGLFVARVDMLYRRERVVVEYDGDQHRTDRAQYERDIARIEAIEALGYRVVRVRASGLLAPDATVARVRRALAV